MVKAIFKAILKISKNYKIFCEWRHVIQNNIHSSQILSDDFFDTDHVEEEILEQIQEKPETGDNLEILRF